MKILIAIDGSPDSKKAVARVAERLWPIQTELKLITVLDPRKSTFLDRLAPPTIRWFIDKANDEKSAAGRMLEIYGKKLRDLDLPLSMNVVVGKPQEEILSAAQKWGAHCIYMGARGLTHMKRFILGGVSCAVSARAHCSVEIVR